MGIYGLDFLGMLVLELMPYFDGHKVLLLRIFLLLFPLLLLLAVTFVLCPSGYTLFFIFYFFPIKYS